jgi:hypothetical protein
VSSEVPKIESSKSLTSPSSVAPTHRVHRRPNRSAASSTDRSAIPRP